MTTNAADLIFVSVINRSKPSLINQYFRNKICKIPQTTGADKWSSLYIDGQGSKKSSKKQLYSSIFKILWLKS